MEHAEYRGLHNLTVTSGMGVAIAFAVKQNAQLIDTRMLCIAYSHIHLKLATPYIGRHLIALGSQSLGYLLGKNRVVVLSLNSSRQWQRLCLHKLKEMLQSLHATRLGAAQVNVR